MLWGTSKSEWNTFRGTVLEKGWRKSFWRVGRDLNEVRNKPSEDIIVIIKLPNKEKNLSGRQQEKTHYPQKSGHEIYGSLFRSKNKWINARSPSPGKASCRGEGKIDPGRHTGLGVLTLRDPAWKNPWILCASGRSNADSIVKTRWIDCRNNKVIFSCILKLVYIL